jgi:hypothetical protein
MFYPKIINYRPTVQTITFTQIHGRMLMDGHGLPKVSLGPAVPYRFLLSRWPPLKQPYSLSGMVTLRTSGLWPSSTPLDTRSRTSLLHTDCEQESLLIRFHPLV